MLRSVRRYVWLALAALLAITLAGCGKSPPPPAPAAEPTSGAPSSAPVSPASDLGGKRGPSQASPDRVAAEWALELGGEVQVEAAGKRVSAKSSADLPADDFRLVSVNLANNKRVTDDGLSALSGAKKLETLNLNGTPITLRGVAHLAPLAGLKYLNLCVSTLSDADLAVMKSLPELYALEISSTQVGDAGLENLKECKSLRTLYVSQTKVTDGGVAALKAALPQLDIKR